MKIYTKFGDAGQTVLFNGERVLKDHLRIETYGTVDELNSALGVAIAGVLYEPLRDLLLRLQHQLFNLGSDLATPLDAKNAAKVRRINADDILALEHEIDAAAAQLPPLTKFVLPGGTITAARLHVARTVCRRAERCLVTLMQHESVGDQAIIYLNRLSDLLFTLARLANKLEGVTDVEWENKK